MNKPEIFIYEEDEAILKALNMSLNPFYTTYSNNEHDDILSTLDHYLNNTKLSCILIDVVSMQSFDNNTIIHLNKWQSTIPVAILLTTKDADIILQLIQKGFCNFIDNPLSATMLVNGIKESINTCEYSIFHAKKIASTSAQFKHYKHDLMNFITVATGYVELLLAELLESDHRIYCEKINLSLDKLVSRIKAGFLTTENSESTDDNINIIKNSTIR